MGSSKGLHSCGGRSGILTHMIHILLNLGFFLIFIFGCVGSFVNCADFSLSCGGVGDTVVRSAWSSHCDDFSCCKEWAL